MTELGSTPERDTANPSNYLRFREAMDPLADDVAAEFAGLSAGKGRGKLEVALDEGIDRVVDPPPALVRLFRKLDAVPYWVDWDRLNKGGAVFLRSGPLGIAVLSLFSLPIMYYSPRGNKPLVFTGHLLERAPRRLAETARFVLSTSKPGGLRRDAEGFKFTVKVRLMHAQVRRLLLRSGRWNAEWGRPINQLYMAGTNVALSVGLLEGLGRLGYAVSSSDAEALLHLWRYSGHLSGVDPELAVATRADGRSLGQFIHDSEGLPDADSKALVAAQMTAAYHPRLEGRSWPGKLSFDLSRKLIGRQMADDLGFPNSHLGWTIHGLYPFAALSGLAHRFIPGLGSASARLSARGWEYLINQLMAGAAVNFEAPARLKEPPMREART